MSRPSIVRSDQCASAALEEEKLSRAQKKIPQNNIEMRKILEKDLQDFLAAGKKIEVVPMGVSGQDRMGRSRNIVISRKRRTGITVSSQEKS